MEDPAFPKKAGPAGAGDSFPKGNLKDEWQTTYKSSINTKPGDYSTSSIDTVALQQTHWTAGKESADMITDYQREFISHPIETREQSRTRDQLMKTSFVLGDGSKMETRESLNKSKNATVQQLPPVSHERLIRSHIELKQDNSTNDWKTTNADAYKPYNAEPAKPVADNLRTGDGARSTMENARGFQNYESESHSQYRNFINSPEYADARGIETGLRSTTFKLGGDQTIYETTAQAAFKPKYAKVERADSRALREKFNRTDFAVGTSKYGSTTSSYQDAFQAHPEFRPPKPVEKSAYASHHEFRNCTETFKSSSQDAYVPHQISPSKPAEMSLQRTHVQIGEPTINENKSLYQTTFKGHGAAGRAAFERVDPDQARSFHTTHHTNVTTIVGVEKPQSEAKSAFISHVGAKPVQPIKFSQDSHVLSMADPSLIVRKSSMKSDFVPHQSGDRGTTVNNKLQLSHLQLKGEVPEDSWSTTQQDYFKFKKYRME